MRKLRNIAMGLPACVGLLIASGASAATTNGNWYGDISGDLSWIRHSDVGGGGNVALGYRFTPNDTGAIRLEGEVGYHDADGDNGYGETHYITYMANGYYDFTNAIPQSYSGMHFTPYVGAGIGDAELHHGSGSFTNTFHHHDNTFAYQGMAGITMTAASMPNADWSVGYRYTGTSDDDIRASNLELGLRFYF